MSLRVSPLLATLCVAFMAPLSAAVIVNNGLPNQSFATDLNANLGADDFTTASNFNITLIRFWTLQADANSFVGSVEWSIRNNNAGEPGTTVASGLDSSVQTATGNSALGYNEFRHEVSVTPFLLSAGSYWLVLHNGPSASQPATDFYWAFSNDLAGNGQAFDLLSGGPWGTMSGELAFQLEGTPEQGGPGGEVPEPGSLALLALGLATFSFFKRSRA